MVSSQVYRGALLHHVLAGLVWESTAPSSIIDIAGRIEVASPLSISIVWIDAIDSSLKTGGGRG